MIHKGAAPHELRDKFREQGGRTLREEGVMCALDGRSSLDEVLRVTHSEDESVTPEPAAKAAKVTEVAA
jgi:hypothetical protein